MRRFLFTLIALATPFAAQAQKGDIYACADVATGAMRTTDDPANCGRDEAPMSWNAIGPQGPEGPQGQRGPAGPVGPMGPTGTGILTKSAVYTVIEKNPNNGGYREAYCEDPDDILLNCSCRQQVSDFTVWIAMAMNKTVSDTPDFCRCVSSGVAAGGGIQQMGHGRGEDFEVHATCVRAAGPVCNGNPPYGYGEVCNGACETGQIACDGSCDAPPAPDDQGDDCSAACRCNGLTGHYYRYTEGEMDCGICRPVNGCGGVCP